MNNVILRNATTQDMPALTSLAAELGYPGSEEEMRSRFELLSAQPEHKIVVAECDGQVVGLMSFHALDLLYGSEKLGRITSIVVTESMRGKGIGKMLIAKAEEFAREAGCKRMELTTNNRRVDAHKFYATLGYANTHKRFTKPL